MKERVSYKRYIYLTEKFSSEWPFLVDNNNLYEHFNESLYFWEIYNFVWKPIWALVRWAKAVCVCESEIVRSAHVYTTLSHQLQLTASTAPVLFWYLEFLNFCSFVERCVDCCLWFHIIVRSFCVYWMRVLSMQYSGEAINVLILNVQMRCFCCWLSKLFYL